MHSHFMMMNNECPQFSYVTSCLFSSFIGIVVDVGPRESSIPNPPHSAFSCHQRIRGAVSLFVTRMIDAPKTALYTSVLPRYGFGHGCVAREMSPCGNILNLDAVTHVH